MTVIDDKVTELQAAGFEVGDPLTALGEDGTGRAWQQFAHAWLLAEADGSCWTIWGATLDAYNRTGGIGTHGYPTAAQVPTGRDDVTTWDFAAGSRIYEINGDTGTSYVLSPPLLTCYDTLGGPTGSLGAPAMDETADGDTWWVQLEHGDALYATAGSVAHLTPPVQAAYAAAGGPTGELGAPQGDAFDSDSGDGSQGVLVGAGTLWVQPDGTSSVVATQPGPVTPPAAPPAGTWPRFLDGADADAWFAAHTAQATFLEWFKVNHAGKGPWAGVSSGPSAQASYTTILADLGLLVQRVDLALPEFLTLVSVMINETGGTFQPISERVGTAQHPGIAYAFDADGKASYNKAPNRTALALFNDADFLDAHGALPLAGQVRETTDQRWAGQVYPVGDFPTSTDPGVSGIVLEADFFKFRGRGVIQTTWRSGYTALVQFVQGYTGSNAVVVEFRERWAGQQADVVATRSTNADWDRLFQASDLEVAREAVRRHNAGGGVYFTRADDRTGLDASADTDGSVRRAGLKVSGGRAYAEKLRNRVFAMLESLGL